MGPGQKFLTWVGSIYLPRVSHLWFGFELEKFPLKTSIFSTFFLWIIKNLFRSGQKVPGSASYLLWVKSKLGSGPISSLRWGDLKASTLNVAKK